MEKKSKTDRPRVRLVGEDGNAYAILGRCRRAARLARWPEERWKAFHSRATASNYQTLLAAVMEDFDVR